MGKYYHPVRGDALSGLYDIHIRGDYARGDAEVHFCADAPYSDEGGTEVIIPVTREKMESYRRRLNAELSTTVWPGQAKTIGDRDVVLYVARCWKVESRGQ